MFYDTHCYDLLMPIVGLIYFAKIFMDIFPVGRHMIIQRKSILIVCSTWYFPYKFIQDYCNPSWIHYKHKLEVDNEKAMQHKSVISSQEKTKVTNETSYFESQNQNCFLIECSSQLSPIGRLFCIFFICDCDVNYPISNCKGKVLHEKKT